MNSGVGSRLPRQAIAAALAAAIACVLAPGVRADGDPASDTLVVRNVFLPYEPGTAGAVHSLEQTVSGVYRAGDRVKVAVILGPDDLGSVQTLFGRSSQYAQFLGIELGLWYSGPVLVAMPTGFGVYDGGHSTAAEESVLGSLTVEGSTSDALIRSATAAVQKLEASGALRSPDVKPPLVSLYAPKTKRGATARLQFDLYDDSGRARAVARVYDAGARLATLSTPMSFTIGTRHVVLRWRVPKTLRSRQLRFCVVAADAAGNASKATCISFLRVG
jgi:hypothetical protein